MTPPGSNAPEARARERIDADLAEAGWVVQHRDQLNLAAGRGVAVREYKLTAGHGYADYLLFLDGKAVGVLEPKPEGHTLSGVEVQARRYADGLPDDLSPPVEPLPFLYLSTGAVTRFTNLLGPNARSRPVFRIHRPETLADWLTADPLDVWTRSRAGDVALVAEPGSADGGSYAPRPSTLRARLRAMPPVDRAGLRKSQVEAITNLEASLAQDRPRALIQMATGTGKTRMAVAAAYRLIKFGGARRVLFLVDRGNLGEQAEKEFQSFRTPDDHRLFTELYGVQRLTTPTIGSSTKVVISTIQRLYSMLRGEPLPAELEDEHSLFEPGALPMKEALPVAYDAAIPPEYFDVIFGDECHRSIYSLWRQVLEYFDATLIGLTATPAKHTFGFFHQNLVMELAYEKAVADGANVDFELAPPQHSLSLCFGRT